MVPALCKKSHTGKKIGNIGNNIRQSEVCQLMANNKRDSSCTSLYPTVALCTHWMFSKYFLDE